MSQDLEDLLAREGHDDVDALMGWARERAAALVPELGGDEELGPLLSAGGEARKTSGRAEAAEALRLEQTAMAARREASNAAPLPPIPVSTPAVPTDELDLDEIEELDMEELEMVDDDDDDEAEGEPTGAGPAPPAPESPPAAAGPEDSASEGEEQVQERGETNSFGPPDGNEHVPEWKAALLSTQTETDQEAAERVKEASSAGPLPEMEFPADDDTRPSARLESEHDELSQHSIDLSDLDPDDE